jgi:hypothetical protein
LPEFVDFLFGGEFSSSNIEWLEVVSKPQIASESKAQADEKAQPATYSGG